MLIHIDVREIISLAVVKVNIYIKQDWAYIIVLYQYINYEIYKITIPLVTEVVGDTVVPLVFEAFVGLVTKMNIKCFHN